MTNFFDLASPQEAARHFSFDGKEPLAPDDVAFERAALDKDKDRNLAYLAYLFAGRGDDKTAQSYLARISNDARRLEASMALYEVRPA